MHPVRGTISDTSWLTAEKLWTAVSWFVYQCLKSPSHSNLVCVCVYECVRVSVFACVRVYVCVRACAFVCVWDHARARIVSKRLCVRAEDRLFTSWKLLQTKLSKRRYRVLAKLSSVGRHPLRFQCRADRWLVRRVMYERYACWLARPSVVAWTRSCYCIQRYKDPRSMLG